MANLFEPFNINKLQIKNRFVRSATVDNLGNNMMVSQAQLDFYRELAMGEVGLIISSGLSPSLDGWAGPGQLGCAWLAGECLFVTRDQSEAR